MKRAFAVFKKTLGQRLTKKIRPLGHGLKALVSATTQGFPARRLVIIGVTGTKGKTSTAVYIGRLANLCGIKTGYITTALINEGDFDESEGGIENIRSAEVINTSKMTTLDGPRIQKAFATMLENRCAVVVIEMSSQGLEQHRHWGIAGFSETVFLNISPEHIEAHGSFEKYKQAKAQLFKSIRPNGVFISQSFGPDTEYMFSQIPDKVRATVARKDLSSLDYQIKPVEFGLYKKIVFSGKEYPTTAMADFEAQNMLTAMLAIESLPRFFNLPAFVISDLLEQFVHLSGVPGRMDWVVQKGLITGSKLAPPQNTPPISILVDYAHDPKSMELLLKTIASWREQKFFDYVIHVLSSDGVGRDDWKKPILGELSRQYANFTVVTTDNYGPEDNPQEILNKLSQNMPNNDSQYIKIISRRDAFIKALELAGKEAGQQKHVLIVSTGVGSEYGLTQPAGVMEWDEKRVWIQEFNRIFPSS